jgi:large subunit ribosomal protein L5
LSEKSSKPSKLKEEASKKTTKSPNVEKKVLNNEKIVKIGTPKETKEIQEQKTDSQKTTSPLEKAKKIEKEETQSSNSQKEKVKTQKKVSEKEVTSKLDSKTNVSSQDKLVIKEKLAPKAIKSKSEWTGNPMRKPVIEKVTVNMSVGKSGNPLQQAVTILRTLTNQEPSKRAAKKTIREFGIRKGESIACLVTIREEKAEEFLRKAFYAIENKLSKYNFDRQGNFSFGIKEHIDLPGTKYAPELGIHGMDVSVSLGRPGYRVKRRHRARSKIGRNHLLTAEEAILFIKDEFDVEIT